MRAILTDVHDPRERTGAALGTVLVHALIAAALVWGLGVPVPRAAERALRLFELAPSPPPPEPSRPPPPRERSAPAERRDARREGAASPPNLRAQASQIVLPKPAIQLPLPPPILAAPVAGPASDPFAGAADRRGPGTGAGGYGDGRGSGAGGGGDGGGGGYGRDRPPRRIRGSLRDSDYPAAAGEAGAGGTVSVRFTVALDGRAVNCRITRSSGSDALDWTTCRVIERRYRFDPSRDWRGRPVLSDVVEDHSWFVEDEPPDPDRDY